MNIQLFNFLEDYASQITEALKKEIASDYPVTSETTDDSLREALEETLDGYIDLLVTGQTDTLDEVVSGLSRALELRGGGKGDVVVVPLALGSVVRRLLSKEFDDIDGPDSEDNLKSALETVDSTAGEATRRFLELIQPKD